MSEPKYLAVSAGHIGKIYGIVAIHNPAYALENESVIEDVCTIAIGPEIFTLELRRRLDPKTKMPWLVLNRSAAFGAPPEVIESCEFDGPTTEKEAGLEWAAIRKTWQKCGRIFPNVKLPGEKSLLMFRCPLDACASVMVTPRLQTNEGPTRPGKKQSLESHQAEQRMHGARLKVLKKEWPAVVSELEAKSGKAVLAYEYESSKQRPTADPIDALLAAFALEWSGKPYDIIRQELQRRGHEISVEALKKRIANLSYESSRKPGPPPVT